MPVISLNGEPKKVACGPCIRGHRSSKCNHKDRVLIEVRKPGRPLGTCPHPPGSCGCERMVINYMIPKDRSGPSLPQGLSPASSATSRVQKSTPTPRSTANLSQSAVQKVISGDPSALAVLASFPLESISISSDTSSQPPSTASSTSTTPKIDALRGTPQSLASEDLKDFTPGSEIWHDGLHDFYNGPPLQNPPPLRPQTAVTSEPSSCCCSKPAETPSTPTFVPQKSPEIPEAMNMQHMSPHPAPYPDPHGHYQHMNNYDMNYGCPPGYSFVNADFPSYELTIGCGGMQPAPSSIPQRMMGDTKDCRCGDTCACFACMTHPNNRTTVDYVRYHNELLSRSSSTIQSSYGPPHLAQGQQPVYSIPFHYTSQSHIQQGPPQFPSHHGYGNNIPIGSQPVPWHQPHTAIPMPHTPVTELERLQFSTQPQVLSTGLPVPSLQLFSQHKTAQDVVNANHSKPPIQQSLINNSSFELPTAMLASQFDADSPRDDDASTLSPSSFLLQQFTVPGCDDITGTCQCGEGCDCPGCLTHSGHGLTEPQSDSKERGGDAEVPNDFLLDSGKSEKKNCCS